MSKEWFEPDPWDYYEEYSEWLMKNYPIECYNSDALVGMLEDAMYFDDFLEEMSNGKTVR